MKERRTEWRLRYQTPVPIQPRRSRRWYNGRMFNFSRKRVYIETVFSGRSGQQISIFVGVPLYATGPYLLRTRIRWVKELAEAVVLYPCGCGVETHMTVDSSANRSSWPIQPRSGEDRRKGPAGRRRDLMVGTGGKDNETGGWKRLRTV